MIAIGDVVQFNDPERGLVVGIVRYFSSDHNRAWVSIGREMVGTKTARLVKVPENKVGRD
jgi:hypothetical protein